MNLWWTLGGVGAVLIGALAFWAWTPDLPRATLEARYLAKPSDMIEVAGTRLHARDTGPREAPAVVLLHGFGASLHTWEPWATTLEATHRVVRFDLPGSGLSEPDATGIYTEARNLELLAALLDRLGIAKAALVGNSVGGRIAWRFAAAHPDRVTKLVLVSPDGFASPGFEYGKPYRASAAIEAMRFVLPAFVLRMSLAPAYGDPAALTDDLARRYHDLMRAPGARAAMIARLRQTVLVDPAPLLARIAAPVLLVWGEKNAMIPVANAQDYLRLLGKARLVTFPDLGHVPHEEAPARTITPVASFLRE
jgi:pimeloyl-ACP methyl ester carboxylesterase